MKKIPSYSPRWLSGFFELIDGLPVPGWLVVAAFWAAVGVVMHLVAWSSGVLPEGQIHPYLAMQGAFIAVIPAAWRVIDGHGAQAMQDYGAALGKPAKDVQEQARQFLSLPALWASVVFVVAAVSGLLEILDDTSIAPIAAEVLPWVSWISWSLSNAFLVLMGYRAVVQIGRMNRLFSELPLDIFAPSAVYTLSRYGAAFAGTILVVGHGLMLLALPEYYFSTAGVFYMGMLSVIGLVVFFAPLTTINRRMRQEKERLLNQLGRDQQQLNERLHKAVGGRSLGVVGELRTAIAALKEQREVLAKLPTWPWQGESLRNLFTPMLIPVFVYLVQRLLSAVFGI